MAAAAPGAPVAAWPGQTAMPTVKTAADLFRNASMVAQHKDGLKVLAFGLPETMKTGFGLSFPDPIVVFDTELGAPPLFRHFVYCPTCKAFTPHNVVEHFAEEIDDGDLVRDTTTGKLILKPRTAKTKLEAWNSFTCRKCGDPGGHMKQIYWVNATFLNPQTGAHDPINALTSLQAAIELLNTVKARTIMLDSGTDVWDWIQEWIDEVGKHTTTGNHLMQTEWFKARLKLKKLLLELMAKPVNLIVTAQTQDVYDKATKKPTGEVIPRIEKTAPHTFDLVIHFKRYEIPQQDGSKKCEYHSDITKCRFQKDYRPVLPQELTYDKLTEAVEKDLGIKVW